MDHLPLPYGVQLTVEDAVPLIAVDKYDNGPFLSYPQRSSPVRPYLSSEVLLGDISMAKGSISRQDIGEIMSFYQTWLYLGFLHEVLDDDFKLDDYVQKIDTPWQRSITMRLFPHHLRIWEQKLRALPMDGVSAKLSHVCQCLAVIDAALRLIPKSESGELTLADEKVNKVVLSIAALAESVCDAVFFLKHSMKLAGPAFDLLPPLRWKDFLITNATSKTLIQNGWCPRQVKVLFNSWITLSMLFYYTKLSRKDEKECHKGCSELDCSAQPRFGGHRTLNCDCVTPRIDSAAITAVLEAGSYPLLQLRRDDENGMTCEIVAAEPSTAYVAISYVWSQGLGDSQTNALPFCQMRYLLDCVEHLEQRRDERLQTNRSNRHFRAPCERIRKRQQQQQSGVKVDREDACSAGACPRQKKIIEQWDSEMMIWVDTICVPSTPRQLRKLALQRMQTVYNQASCVLVLDDLLRTYSGSADTIDLCANILVSGWSTRLWTSLECELAAELWLKTKNDCIDLWDTWHKRLAQNPPPAYLRGLEMRISFGLSAMKQINYRTLDFRKLYLRVANRKTTKEVDETFCLAVLMELDTSGLFTREDVQSRIKIFWEQLAQKSDIPADIILFQAPRIGIEGFRWAPRTLLNGLDDQSFMNFARSKPAILTASGLRISFSAIKFDKPVPCVGFLNRNVFKTLTVTMGSEPGKDFLVVKVDDGLWLTLRPAWPLEKNGEMTTSLVDDLREHGNALIILTPHDLADHIKQRKNITHLRRGVFAIKKRIEDKIQHVRWLKLLDIEILDQPTRMVYDLALKTSQNFLRDTEEGCRLTDENEMMKISTDTFVESIRSFCLTVALSLDERVDNINALHGSTEPRSGRCSEKIAYMFGLVYTFISGRYLTIKEFLPDDSIFIID